MTLIVVPTASPESYASVATATAYHAKMGNAAWSAATEANQEIALRRATQYLDSKYAFKGEPYELDQPLSFPRTGFDWPVRKLVDATCELALRALDGPLLVDLDASAVKSEKVGPIEIQYDYTTNSGQTRYALIDDLLRDLVAGGASGSSNVRLVRS